MAASRQKHLKRDQETYVFVLPFGLVSFGNMVGAELKATRGGSSQIADMSVVAEFTISGFILTFFPSMGVDMIGWEG
jgi:hypothetical protein